MRRRSPKMSVCLWSKLAYSSIKLHDNLSALTQLVDPRLTNIRPKTVPTFAWKPDLYRTFSQKESDPRKYLN